MGDWVPVTAFAVLAGAGVLAALHGPAANRTDDLICCPPWVCRGLPSPRKAQVVDEPVAGQHRDLLKCAGFFEEVSGARNHGELALAGYRGPRPSIQLRVPPRRDPPTISSVGARTLVSDSPGEIGPAAAGDHRATLTLGSAAATRAAPAPVLAPK